MADDDLDDDLDDVDGELGDDLEEGGGGEKGSKKRLILFVGLPLLLVIGGLAGAYFTGLLNPLIAMITGSSPAVEGEADGGAKAPGVAVFYDLPEILVNLSTGGRKTSFLKIKVSLEVASQGDIVRVEEVLPRIVDNFQVYLRELRVEDLKGSAGMYRLREELLTRVNVAVAPAKVNDVLFKEMLVQ
ncbi:MAG: flagellar basal body-associated FliL family protein [Rhodospirillales bacterium]|nr:flagellar basal body-associated FliL family protein [Rhodospirillales bacterium]MCW8862817.1 flagellar basal body-associated FliL family protein [Rhodospirillales bacterium]MCW8951104.1 flagellar basal body-associated FliL family protein [Rhodospirillales bacterium]MCW8971087.1 flagellar basal body-associated FliL family protein [Rhodospirillales bacterium]MCW9002896.1 flagellar basal body-associated FliL family protein [Rhodospirillales bacterium]